jgi:hypothetical protein
MVLIKQWSTRTEYAYGTQRSILIFIWSIWDSGYRKNISVVEKHLKIFGFSYYISIIYLNFDENSGKNGDKK